MKRQVELALLVGAALLAMGGALSNGLVQDGARLLLHDSRFVLPIDWDRLVLERWWPQGLWRPMTMLLLGTEVRLGGEVAPVVLHAVSLLLYLGCVGLGWGTIRRFGAPAQSALVAALLFAVHPLHVEVVASVVGQAEMLVMLATLGAAILWHRAATTGATPAHLIGLLGCQLLAAGAKEQGYVLPMLLVGQQLFLHPRLPRRIAARWLAILILLACTLWTIRAGITGSLAGDLPAPYLIGLTPAERVMAAVGTAPFAGGLLLTIVRPQTEYSPPLLPVGTGFGALQLVGALLLAAGTFGIWWWRTRRPIAAYGLWWAAVTWLPASSLLVPAGLLLADRVLFLPSMGIAFTLAALGWPRRPERRRLLIGIVALAATVLALRSARRMTDWRDGDRFQAAMTEGEPRSYRAWFVAGNIDRDAGRWAAAETKYRTAMVFWRNDNAVHEELGQLLRRTGRCAEAIPIMREGLALDTARTQLRAKLKECERQVESSADTTRVGDP